MTPENWYIIFIISLILTVISAFATIIITVKYKVFSLLRFNAGKYKNKIQISNTEKTENSVSTEQLKQISAQVITAQRTPAGVETVLADTGYSSRKTSKLQNEFEIIKNIIVIHTDSSVIDKIIQQKNDQL